MVISEDASTTNQIGKWRIVNQNILKWGFHAGASLKYRTESDDVDKRSSYSRPFNVRNGDQLYDRRQ